MKNLNASHVLNYFFFVRQVSQSGLFQVLGCVEKIKNEHTHTHPPQHFELQKWAIILSSGWENELEYITCKKIQLF